MENKDLNDSIRQIGEAMTVAIQPLSIAVAALHSAFTQLSVMATESLAAFDVLAVIDVSKLLRDMVDDFNIAHDHWADVSPEAFDRLTPEQRWAYQKWVWGAPLRWIRSLFQL